MKIVLLIFIAIVCGCSKKKESPTPPEPPSVALKVQSVSIDGVNPSQQLYNIGMKPTVKILFTDMLDAGSVSAGIQLLNADGSSIPLSTTLEDNKKTLSLVPRDGLNHLSRYVLKINNALQSTSKVHFQGEVSYPFITQIDSSDKFPLVSDDALLTIIQKQTFKYFWDFGHPVSGMARERNTSGDVVTTGGTGFGVMSILVGINRGFISRQDGFSRISKIVSFLKNNCTRYHGAFSHWINGASGATVPFSEKDNGGDLVETSFLMQGLLCARQFFDGGTSEELQLQNDINDLWKGVEWDWYTQGEKVLYWHWSNEHQFEMNHKIQGWNEALITYILAASSSTHTISKDVYDEGWARSGAMKNGSSYLGVTLPLGPSMGGPLFFAHYSFLGLNPNGLSDAYADYFEQNKAHSLINQHYCANNPKQFFGYSDACWGLTASDDDAKGYDAHSPTNDDGVISPTAAISSLPYTPEASMKALRFFYYTLGDKIFKEYGFVDAFNLNTLWFANSFLAIDQGPQVVMIENYRSGLLWDLFMSAPEVKAGLLKLGFTSPDI